MGKKKISKLDSLLNDAFNKITDNGVSVQNDQYIPDILEFCYSKKYLNLPSVNVKLFPMQEIILKSFYRGQRGNENTNLTDEEIELLQSHSMQDVIDKYNSNHKFRELVLVLGRRCISEDTKIMQADGSMESIGNLWDQGFREISTFGLNEDNYEIGKANNCSIIENGFQSVYKLTLTDGRNIDVTDNHPFLTIDGWKDLKDLKINDRVCVPKIINCFGNDTEITEDMASLLGMADDAIDKITPKKIFTSPKSVIAAYLKSIFSHKTYFTTVSENLAKSIHHLLIRFGIFSYLRKTSNTFQLDINDELEILLNQEFKNSDDIIWLPIKSIEKLSKKRTFDISVPIDNQHNFIANDIISHNSGKDFLVSLMALYEAMTLLEIPGGSPIKYYNLAPGNPIYIMAIATSADQAKVLFNEINSRMQYSTYFKDKIGKKDADRIYLKTPEDIELNKELKEQGLDEIPGSIVILSGHSNSDSLLGKRVFSLMFDEVASYKSSGASSGETLYTHLLPCTTDFGKFLPDGTKELDSKVISISSPRGEEGILYKLWSETAVTDRRLTFKLPTWKVNLSFTEEMLRKEFKMPPSKFNMEFGAQFSGTAGEKFINDHYVEQAQLLGAELKLTQRIQGIPGVVYYAHLDPASSSHNYALAIVHVEDRIRIRDGKNGNREKERYKLFVVDHLKTWTPDLNKYISVKEVDDYILSLSTRFRFGYVTYDIWNSDASIQKLRSRGIPSKQTPYRRSYKIAIYDHLESLLINEEIALPNKYDDAELLADELKCLKRIYSGNGYQIKPDPNAPVTTDDLVDALAGACKMACGAVYGGYAKSGMVYLPHNAGNQQWKIGTATHNNQQWKFLREKFGR